MALLYRNMQSFMAHPQATQPTQPTPTSPVGPSPYRAVFDFQPQSQASTDIMNPNEAIGTPNRGRDAYLNINDPHALDNLSSSERDALIASGAITSTAGMYSGDGGDTGADTGWQINYDKLPQAMGPDGKTPVNVASLTPTNSTGSNLLNPQQRWQDPTYGNVAMSQNNKGYIKDGWDKFYNIAPSLFMAGMGGMAMSAMGAGASSGGMFSPSNMMKMPQMVQGFANGGFNPQSFLSNMAMNYLNVPSYARPFLQYGMQQVTRPKPPGG